MKTIEELLYELNLLNVKLWVENDQLRYKAPKGALTPSLRAELVERKAEMMAFISEQTGRGFYATLPSIAPISRDEHLPLSYAQQRLWFLDQLEGENATYNMPAAVRLEGRLNIVALEQSLQEIVQRHETLRTTFPMKNGEPVVQLLSASSEPLPIINLAALPDKELIEKRLVSEEAKRPFDLSKGPLLRTTLLQLGINSHILLVTMHHIISDGWSVGLLIRELSTLYEAFSQKKSSPLPPLPIQYIDFAHWQRQWLTGAVLERQINYWQQQLAGSPARLELPTDYPRPPIKTFRGNIQAFEIPTDISQQLTHISQQSDVTLFMTLLAAFVTLLSRYSGQQDIIVGTPIANRNRSEIEPLIGFFINTLVLRTQLSGNPRFTELLAQVKQVCVEAYDHQDVPFEQLVDALQPGRNLSHSPLFQVMLVLQNTPAEQLKLSGLTMSRLALEHLTAKFDLTLSLEETPQGLVGSIEYSTDLFKADTIARMVGYFQTLLAGIVAQPTQSIAQLPLLTEPEKHQLLVEWNNTFAAYPQQQCIHQQFEAQVERTPEAIAVVFDDQHLSYAALNQKANQLAHYLQTLNIKPEVLVGICIERSLEMIIGVLGILKAGGAYVPLDPNYPKERLTFLLEDANVPVLLTLQQIALEWPTQHTQVVCLDSDWDSIRQRPDNNPISEVTPNHLAYVIYTSGSTGKPKGVLVTHYNVTRLFAATYSWFQFNEHDVWTLFHSYAFDFSVWELWGALLYGGRLVVVPYWISRSPEAFYELLGAQGVTVLNQTPSAFRQLIQAEERLGISDELHLRWIIFGGEALEFQSLKPWFARHGDQKPQLVNMYGITETTVHVTYRPLTQADLNSPGSVIGWPIPDLQAYLLDRYLQLVPIGVPGELHIGGAGLAIGYLNRPELSTERFINNPFRPEPEARLYKTGDLARYLPDGQLEYLGRVDNQVKIRGFRIELGEIEAALMQSAGVQQTVVTVQTDSEHHKTLVAYVVPNQSAAALTVHELRQHLKKQLPDYMVPATFVMLDRLPLTAHGKVDYRALPAPDATPVASAATVAPRTLEEEVLASIWTEVLNLKAEISIDDNFFELGGDSILSIKVLAKAKEAGLTFSLQQLFQAQTLQELARSIRQPENGYLSSPKTEYFSLISEDERLKLPADIEDAYPLSALQAGMIFHSEYNSDSSLYHNVSSVHLRLAFDEAKLRSVLQQLAERHSVLRTSFALTHYSEPLQLVHRTVSIPLAVEDWCHLSIPEQENSLNAWFETEKQRHFDWSSPPLWRFQVHRRSEDSFQLSWTEHHAILDGWSVASMMTELFQYYLFQLESLPPEGFENGASVVNLGLKHQIQSPPAITFRDFVALEQRTLESEQCRQYWLETLQNITILKLPRWHRTVVRAPSKKTPIEALNVPLTAEISTGLKLLAQTVHVPIKSILLAAHLRVLNVLSNQNDILTGFVSNGRPEETDGEKVLGLFLNTLPFRLHFNGGTWIDLVRETFKAEHSLLPYRRFPLAEIQRIGGGQPLFETAFNFTHFHVYQGLLGYQGIEILSGQFVAPTNFTLLADFGLDLTTKQINFTLSYDTGELCEEQIIAISGYYTEALTAMATSPTARYEAHSLLSDSERQQLLVAWNNTTADYPKEHCIHQLFEEQVERTPEAIAIEFDGQSLSYAALNQKANQLAHHLQTLGVMPDVLVGLGIERSIEMLIGVLGILKAGGAYVPLDPNYPQERLAFMLADSQVLLLVTQDQLTAKWPDSKVPVLCLDTDWKIISKASQENPVNCVVPNNLAYVIYTSGTTGKPKGVAMIQEALANLIRWQIRHSLSNAKAKTLQFAPISFDVSFQEMFTTWCSGGTLVLIPEQLRKDTITLLDILNKHFVERLFLPFIALQHIAEVTSYSGKIPTNLREIITAGEQLRITPAISSFFNQLTHCTLHNHYGPSESHVVTAFTLTESVNDWQTLPPIGRPIANTKIYILDRHLQSVPVGVPGELYIAGMGLARGYLNRPDLTADKFIPNPFNDGHSSRLYKTGDLARYLADGNIDFLGRIDNQVKLRGFRIELGEIEAALAQHPTIRQTTVLLREDQVGEQCIVAYVVPHEKATPTPTELRDFIKEKLPQYMIPSALMILEKLPLTPNGKLDRRALPVPEDIRLQLEVTYVKPQTNIEQLIAEIWQKVLKVKKVGIYDNFFELGGHSLLMVQIQSQLQQSLERKLPIVELFQYPTIHALAQYLTPKPATQVPSQSSQKRANNRRVRQVAHDIAIIGMACRFPGAKDIEAFWQNLQNGVESISFFSDEELLSSGIDREILNQPNYVKANAVLSDIELFDAAFFDFSPKEAEIMEPQHRLFLESAYEALENAGYEAGTNEYSIGVYAGAHLNTYLLNNLYPNRQLLAESVGNYQAMIGNTNDFLPTRVSYKLNLTGPSVNIQTACSTSLVAVHEACQSLLDGECDMALAGGVSARVPQKAGYFYIDGMISSPDGHCRAFDAKALGTVDADGVGIVVLKRLEDAMADGDCIHAIIKGSAINNDGSLKVGYTAPSVDRQAAVISEAQAVAGIETDTITYIEAHGTGTTLGDPIEIAALTKAFQNHTQKKGFCAIGSVKTNIGHTAAAAGVAGLIKTVLAMKHQLLPPSLHFEQPNPQIDFANSPFYVNNTLSEWKTNGIPRRAGVSSFGIGGTNAHAVLEEAPIREPSSSYRPWQLLVLSAKTPSALNTAAANLATYLEQHPDVNLADVAYTLSQGRQTFSHRRMLVAQQTDNAVIALHTVDPKLVSTHFQESKNRPVVFMFSGQGAQYVNMGQELYQNEPIFREQVDRCSEYLKPHLGLDLRQVLYPNQEHASAATEKLNQTAITQPALFVIEYALAKLWMAWGIYPEAMIGHSIGEYVAASLAGVFSLEDALSLVAARGKMMQQLPGGAMLAVSLSESEIKLGPGLSIAAINGQTRCVISGLTEAVEALPNQLLEQGIECRRLHTSHAFHSEMMEPILVPFTERVKQVKLNPPQIPYLSNVTGNWITAQDATHPSYWGKHLRQTVRFAEGLQHLLEDQTARIMLEVGPGQTLSTLAKQYPNPVTEPVILSSLRHPQNRQSDNAFLLNTLGKLWLASGAIDWSGFYANEHRHRLPLPTYPFERQRYWINPPGIQQPIQQKSLPITENANQVNSISDNPIENVQQTYLAPRNELEQTIADIFAQFLGIEPVGIDDDFFELGGDSLIAVSLFIKLRETFQISLPPESLLQAPTVAQLAELIEENDSNSPLPRQPRHAISSNLVAIQPTGSKSPFFCVHPIGGHVLCYAKLAHHLGSAQPFYGLQATGLEGKQEPLTRIEDMADSYIKALRVVQPKGPYQLGGWSFGGLVAFEIAQQLLHAGEKVALLALIDIGVPTAKTTPLDEAALLGWFAVDLGVCSIDNVGLLVETLRELNPDAQLVSLLAPAQKLNILPSAAKIDDIRPLVQVFKANFQALCSYVPQSYSNRITLFRARDLLPVSQTSEELFDGAIVEPIGSLLDWGELSPEPLEICTVLGNHYTIIAQPHVEQLAQQLRRYLNK